MSWLSIESQSELEALDRSVCWEDSCSVEYYATTRNEDYFPSDVSRTGYLHKNIYILCRIRSQSAVYLEMVWIHCDWFSSQFMDYPHLSNSRIDSLKRLEIRNADGSVQMRCSRLIYRFVAETDVTEGSYYVRSEYENES